MSIQKILILTGLVASLGACDPNFGNTTTGRTVGGAVLGAALADVTDNDALTGAAIGAVGGAASCGLAGLPACN